MKPYLWWWVFLLAVFVFIGWATGSAHTGADVARYAAFTVVGVTLAVAIGSGFVELRQRAAGVIRDEEAAFQPPAPSIRGLLTSCVLVAICASLAIHEARADWLAFAVALAGVLLFGGRLLAMLVQSRRRAQVDRQAS